MIHTLTINDGLVQLNDTTVLHLHKQSPEDIYRQLGYAYPKFFKMDVLCKWAWLGAELLLKQADGGPVYAAEDRDKVAVVLATGSGCLAVDKKYQESIRSIASPALFVYTLPNIMLGEICIRHGFKGEQLCLVQDGFNKQEVSFWVNDLFKNRGMKYCLFGWVEATGEHDPEVRLYWAENTDAPIVHD